MDLEEGSWHSFTSQQRKHITFKLHTTATATQHEIQSTSAHLAHKKETKTPRDSPSSGKSRRKKQATDSDSSNDDDDDEYTSDSESDEFQGTGVKKLRNQVRAFVLDVSHLYDNEEEEKKNAHANTGVCLSP